MPATKTASFLPITNQQTLFDQLVVVGQTLFTQVDNYIFGTEKRLVLQVEPDIFIQWRVLTSLKVGAEIFSAWDSINHLGTDGSGHFFQDTLTTEGAEFIILSSPDEVKICLVRQGAKQIALGCVVPFVKPDWWGSAWPFGFVPDRKDFFRWRSTSKNPYGNFYYELNPIGNTRLADPNPWSQRRDFVEGLIFLNQSSQGIAAKTSDDVICVAGSGMTTADILEANNKEYVVLSPTSGSFGVRYL
jgi:hypothetical protein